MSKNKDTGKWFYIVLFALVAALMLRFFAAFRFVILMVLLVAATGFGIYFIVLFFRKLQRDRAFAKSTEGLIQLRLEYCKTEIKKNQREITEIGESINELEETLKATHDIVPVNREETQNVLSGFTSELKFREAKVAFFKTCTGKLESLWQNHRLSRELADKKQKLIELQEDNYEDLASMEELKSNVEMDTFYLDTIEELSLKMLESTTYDDAESLRLELEEMTKELDRL